ncbi:hypothetical protein FEM48_Zijuj04G0194400 [Ziziphus jujuba var. spinosa]|uniref:Uncharacterized protein n=1 Tax=Ziziphus jujuba var. spinosa TaxID=714518 RepID=A0A978VLR1_ZIZJJ|nr:hypothetical protein FEM48_Zijuj04G0194400 [Ziziphus jujuba var. spinosa]
MDKDIKRASSLLPDPPPRNVYASISVSVYGTYRVIRLAHDIGFRDDATKIEVEELAPDLCLENSCACYAAFFLHAADQYNEGMSALQITAEQGHVNVMELIISYKPDARDLVDNRGCNPLHVATVNANLNAVTFILKKPRLESLINAVDNEANTPLHLAAGRNKYSIITILVNDIRVHKKTQNHNFQKPIDLIQTNPNIGSFTRQVV